MLSIKILGIRTRDHELYNFSDSFEKNERTIKTYVLWKAKR